MGLCSMETFRIQLHLLVAFFAISPVDHDDLPAMEGEDIANLLYNNIRQYHGGNRDIYYLMSAFIILNGGKNRLL